MKVLSISTDRKLFEDKSAILERSLEYAKKTEDYYIIAFTKSSQHFQNKSIGNLHIYPTNSLTKLGYVFKAVKIGKEIILKNNLSKINSVISTQDPFETGLVGLLLQRKFSLPFQVQIHTDFLNWHFRKSPLNSVRFILSKFVLPQADGIRVVNQVIKDSIKKHFPKIKVAPKVLPVFVDIESIMNREPVKSLESQFPEFKFIIFMASRLTKEKRIDVAIKALKKVLIEFPHTGLIIAGSGSEMQRLKRLADRLGVSKSVVFIGWQNDLISYYKTADLFLLTSEYEGYGMTLIEAAAAGCPIVTTEVGIAKTDAFRSGENCLICPIGNDDYLAKSISELIHNNADRELFKHRMQDSIKIAVYPREEYVTRYIGLLENLLKHA